jgi:hypothetical protein
MALLAGSIPLIAIQAVALRIDDKIALHFVHVLNQTTLRSGDVHELGSGSRSGTSPTTDLSYWQGKVSADVLARCNAVLGESYKLVYHKVVIDVANSAGGETPVWINPQKTLMRLGAYVADPENWAKRFNDLGQLATLRRGNKAVAVSFKPSEFDSQRELISEFLQAALCADGVLPQ